MAARDGIEAGFVDRLLALKTREQQEARLRGAGLLSADGLDRLLDVADRLLNDDPGEAHRLAELCAGLAGNAHAPVAVPRAMYVLAGVHDVNGEFDAELRLTKAARDGYVALGMHTEALRTDIGKMGTLLDMGRYRETLDVGRAVLNALEDKGSIEASRGESERSLLAALVHQNRGICFEHTGQYEEALRAYALAEELYRNLGVRDRLAEVLDNRGNVLSYLGRGGEALASHKAAAEIFEETGFALSYARSLSNLGETYLRLSSYMKGLNVFERARRVLEPFDAHSVEYFLLRNTADAYLALNLHAEALAAYQEAGGSLQSAGMEHDHARALRGMGSALMARSELERAEEALAEAAGLFGAAGNVPMLAEVMLEQASILKARGSREEALEAARKALHLVSGGIWPVQQVYARLRLADILLPDAGAAEPHLLAGRRVSDRLALPQLRYRLNERLGHLRRLQGRQDEARVLLEAAVDEIERMRGSVAQDAMRVSFLRDKTAAYEDLLLLHLSQDDEEGIQRAFAVAERAKSRALVDLLTGVAEEEPVRSSDPELEERLRASQADLNAAYSELLGGRADEGRPVPLPNLHARINELEQEISRLRLQSAAVDFGTDPFSSTVPPDGVQDRLPPDVTLLAYHAVGDEILAFVSARGRVRVARRLSTVGEVEKHLHRLDIQWERFRADRGFAGRHMAMLERSTRQVLAAIYEELVAPVEALLEGGIPGSSGTNSVQKVAVVPHGPLHRVPFHALFDGEFYLIERLDISYAPSVTVYALCQDREPPRRNGSAVFGVEDPLIPAAVAEARAVADRLPGAGMHLDADATIAALRNDAAGSSILHLACHGLFRSDNPMFSALKLHDGWLMATDAMSLGLPGALVTLSACESGRSEVIGGDEVLGLTRAFLGAGAATLVVSLWLVQDETTAELMASWYELLRGGEERAAALRVAQLDLKERYPHPYFWAPFVLIGKR